MEMTSEEIKKAFNICCSTQTGCTGCPILKLEKQNGRLCKYNLFTSVISLITEQEKEIEKITEEINFWRKVNNTALILTKEECSHKVILNDNDLESLLKDVKKKTQKETAQEILKYLYEKIGNAPLSDIELVNYLAKQYGVEVEE